MRVKVLVDLALLVRFTMRKEMINYAKCSMKSHLPNKCLGLVNDSVGCGWGS